MRPSLCTLLAPGRRPHSLPISQPARRPAVPPAQPSHSFPSTSFSLAPAIYIGGLQLPHGHEPSRRHDHPRLELAMDAPLGRPRPPHAAPEARPLGPVPICCESGRAPAHSERDGLPLPQPAFPSQRSRGNGAARALDPRYICLGSPPPTPHRASPSPPSPLSPHPRCRVCAALTPFTALAAHLSQPAPPHLP